MKKVITYGTFDLLHHGHINLLKRARELGDYLIVGVTSSDFDTNRGKINVKQSLMERIEAVKETGLADEVIPEEYFGQKIDDIRNRDIDIFAIGSDWKGHFDYLKEYCDVVYIDRTQGVSSTQLRNDINHLSLGIIGSSRDVEKFIYESRYVSGVSICGVFADESSYSFSCSIPTFSSFEDLIEASDAVYVANNPEKRFQTAQKVLENNLHVLCESPVALSGAEAKSLFDLASEKNLVFHEAIKTAYALAFSRLILLVKSGMIGTVVSIRSTCTSLTTPSPSGSLIEWGPIACLPIFSILGTDYYSADASSLVNPVTNNDAYTKVNLHFESACASFEAGTGVKSEGDLVISGTKGYVYVPSPWWKTDYFEVRFEDFSKNKRYFYQLNGEGIRDEISIFARTIQDGKKPNLNITEAHTIALANLLGSYFSKEMPIHILKRNALETTISFFEN